MKKQLFVWLLTGAASHGYVQAQPYFVPNSTPVSQTVFSPVEPGTQQCNFFVWLPENNRIWFELPKLNHLSQLPDPDSVIAQTARLLDPLLDSFEADGWLRRIEVDITHTPALFRVTTHSEKPKAFTRMEDELVQVKMDQDTIRIKCFAEGEANSFITLLLNQAADIREIGSGTGARSVELITQAVEKNYPLPVKYSSRHHYYAAFNLQTGQMVSPGDKNYHAIKSGSDQIEITLLKPSLAYARGNVFTGFSFGAAFNFERVKGPKGSRIGLGFYWEPQFSFRTGSNGKIEAFRNEFLTFRAQEFPPQPHASFEVLKTLSLGYLIRNSGNYFEKNTFRLGLPGVAAGRLYLEPELYFNDFFKNVSPGIRLSMKIL